MDLIRTSRTLSGKVAALRFAKPVHTVYNPLDYARAPVERYLELYGRGRKEILFLGMNPGPFGMVQTGVPFGDVSMVRDSLGITGAVARPSGEHAKRPVLGFECPRAEVSGTRLWGWVRDRFETPAAFFRRHFVYNYCPLAFLEESGKNRTPDKLPPKERDALFAVCDEALVRVVQQLEPAWVIGIGGFAERRARAALNDGVRVGTILHPSPASPRANRGWAEAVDAELRALGL